ncbi:hypothetical protein AB0G81_39690, partial [Streptomyces asoensis]
MRLLVLGGTEFAGRAVVEAALGRGWDVTVFHRGRHAPAPGTRVLNGDRTAPGWPGPGAPWWSTRRSWTRCRASGRPWPGGR